MNLKNSNFLSLSLLMKFSERSNELSRTKDMIMKKSPVGVYPERCNELSSIMSMENKNLPVS